MVPASSAQGRENRSCLMYKERLDTKVAHCIASDCQGSSTERVTTSEYIVISSHVALRLLLKEWL